MYARRTGGNRDRLGGLRPQHVPGRRHELREDQRGGRRGRGREVVLGRDQGPLERRRQGEAPQPGLECLGAAPVILAAERGGGEQPLRGPQYQPQRIEAVALGPAARGREQGDQPLLAGSGGGGHAATPSTAWITSAGVMSPRHRWWPRGHVAVPMAEQGRQSRSRCSTRARAREGKNPNCSTVGPKSATTGVATPV